MDTLKTIVVEDELLPRLALLKKLEGLDQEVEVIDSCDNYDSALQSILRLQPDLLFLDIQLQGRDAMQLLEEVRQTIPLPYIIFTTAYAERNYLMSAIKLAAVDYLLKPIGQNELAAAVAKVRRLHSLKSAGESSESRMSLRTANGRLFVDVADIAFVTADGNYSFLHTFAEQEYVLESLASIGQALDTSVFLRVDRGTIINTRLVYKLNVKRNLCILRSPEGALLEVELSKTGMERLMRAL